LLSVVHYEPTAASGSWSNRRPERAELLPDCESITSVFTEIKRFWESRVTAWALGAVAFIAASYFLWHSPTPGVAIAVLGSVAVVISLRKLKPHEKVFWTIVATLLLVGELRAIRVDRSEQIRHQLLDERSLNEQFAVVRDDQDRDFQKTARKLETAILDIQFTLTTATRTLEQTRPVAIMRQDRVEFSDQTPGQIKKPGEPLTFNDWFSNAGNADALLRLRLVKLYVAKPDDKEAQLGLVREFEQDWHVAEKTAANPFVLVPFSQRFISTSRAFTVNELRDITQGTKEIYVLERFEYSDSTGIWRSDYCASFQSATSMNVQVPCKVFIRQRYPVKRER
jgi:hypothetical protein